MKIKAEEDSSIHPSVQNDFLLYASKFIVQSHFTTRELPITIPIHIYYCFMTCLKLWAVLYLITVWRKGVHPISSLQHDASKNKTVEVGAVSSCIILQIHTKFAARYHPCLFLNISSLQASFSCWIPVFCIIISADVSDSICQVESHFVISSPYFQPVFTFYISALYPRWCWQHLPALVWPADLINGLFTSLNHMINKLSTPFTTAEGL